MQTQQEKLREEQERREQLERRIRELENELMDARAALFQSELKAYELASGEKEGLYPEVLLEENKRLHKKIREVAEDTRPMEEIERLQTELGTKEPLLNRMKEDLRRVKMENQRLESENNELKGDIELNMMDLKEIPMLREELARMKIEMVARKEESDQIQIENNTLREKILEIGEELLLRPGDFDDPTDAMVNAAANALAGVSPSADAAGGGVKSTITNFERFGVEETV